MKRLVSATAFVSCIAVLQCTAPRVRSLPHPPTIEDAVDLPNADFDPAFVTLLAEARIEEAANPRDDVSIVDGLAAEASDRLEVSRASESDLKVLSGFLFVERGFGPKEGARGRDRPFTTLHGLLHGDGGNCFPLSVLLVSVCRRLGITVELVSVGSHCFVQQRGHLGVTRIETTSGEEPSEEDYIVLLGLSGDESFRALTNRQICALALAQAAGGCVSRDPECALSLSSRAIAIDNTLALPWYNHGAALAELGRCAAGLSSIERAIRIRPDMPLLRVGKATVLHKLGRKADTRRTVRAALEIPMRSGHRWAQLAALLHSRGVFIPALWCIRRAIELEPDNADFLRLRRRITLDAPLE